MYKTAIALCLVLSLTIAGCSHHKKTTTTTEHSYSNPPYSDSSTTETKTVTENEEKDDGCGGVLSCTVDVVGDVIALPFKAVGYLVSAVF